VVSTLRTIIHATASAGRAPEKECIYRQNVSKKHSEQIILHCMTSLIKRSDYPMVWIVHSVLRTWYQHINITIYS